jgi:broad specificity phosphatase PhoE
MPSWCHTEALCPASRQPPWISQLALSFVIDNRWMRSSTDSSRVLWLVRHGETTWNSMGWIQGHVDAARLTRLGRRQARRAAEQLGDERVGAVVSSDLYRARRTASVIAERSACEVRTDRRLRERCFGIAEGVPSTRIGPTVSGIHDGYVVDEHTRAPGGESLHDVYLRCASFLRSLYERPEDGNVVVVAHGGSIRMLRALAAQVELRGLAWDTVPNASIYRLVVPGPEGVGRAF